jgi:excisionase family DNA binding protein
MKRELDRATDLACLPLVLTVREFLSVMPVPRSTAYRLLKEKQIRSVRLGRHVLIPRDSLVDLLAAK